MKSEMRTYLKWFLADNTPSTHNALGINSGVNKSYFIFQGKNKHIWQKKTVKRNPEVWLFSSKAQRAGVTEERQSQC